MLLSCHSINFPLTILPFNDTIIYIPLVSMFERSFFMARNKYPEVTVNKILEASMKLFLENGFEQTTIQDIVNELGGLTKGAIYHHFKSKEDIINELNTNLFHRDNPFKKAANQPGLNALQKIRTVFLYSSENIKVHKMNIEALSLLKNSRFLSELIESNQKVLAPCLYELIKEGIADGSIHTEYPKQLSEVIVIMTNFWLIPTIFPATPEELKKKLHFIKDFTNMMGVPIFDKETFDALALNIKNVSSFIK